MGVEEQRVNVIVDFVDSPEKRPTLGDGYRIEARIVTWQQDNVLKVPTSALFRQGEQWAVFRMVDGRARLTPVEIGKQNGLEAQVIQGINAEDVVIVHPNDKIVDGVKVVQRDAATTN